VVESVLGRPDEDGTQLRVDRFDRLDRSLDQLDRGHLAPADQISLGGRVEPNQISRIHQWFSFVSPVLLPLAEETPGRHGNLKPTLNDPCHFKARREMRHRLAESPHRAQARPARRAGDGGSTHAGEDEGLLRHLAA
jgi:hypothetical protein